MKFLITYAFDVPHYTDFIVEAETESAAIAAASAAMEAGQFNHCAGNPNYETTDLNPRVFSGGIIDPQAEADHPALSDIIQEGKDLSTQAYHRHV